MFEDWVVDNWYGKDIADNNPLHYAYIRDMPDIRQILRENKLEESAEAIEGNKVAHA